MAGTQDGNRDLWCAVIRQALADATGHYTASPEERAEARAWFEHPNDDFDATCALAGYEPCQMRKEALASIAESDARPPRPAPRARGECITFKSESLTIHQWADRLGMSEAGIRARLRHPEWSLERALTTPSRIGSSPEISQH